MLSLNTSEKNVSDKELRNKHKRLTVAELKNYKGFENYSEVEAEKTINTLEKLSILFYELFMKQNQSEQGYPEKRIEAFTNGKAKGKRIANQQSKKGNDENKQRNVA